MTEIAARHSRLLPTFRFGMTRYVLALALVVRPCGATHAAEVEAQHGQALLLKRLGSPEHHLEVHHPAVQRVGVADDRRRGRLALGVHQHRFQAAGRAGEIKSLVA